MISANSLISNSPTARVMGKVGLPAPIKELTKEKWDVVIVGAGHNGLTCATYLARAGKKVLVLEARDRVGGACTLEETWTGYRISPCAYLVGLLHPLVIKELDMGGNGLEWEPLAGGLFVPFDDDSSIQLWNNSEQCEAEIKRFAPQDLKGWRAMHEVMVRAATALRLPDEQDMWIGSAPNRAMIEDRLRGDSEAIKMLFEWSMVEYLERYLSDERMQMCYLGQGVIGTKASPYDPGTAYIYFHHFCSRLSGTLGSWGYVKGGMGMISFILCDVAQKHGVSIATSMSVARIHPGQGVELEGGERIHAPIVVSNTDPRTTLKLLEGNVDEAWRAKAKRIPIESCVVKINAALSELPNFNSRPGTRKPHHQAVTNTPLSKKEWQICFDKSVEGHLPERVWTEIFFQTVCDPSVAPPGEHVMSILAQYVPHTFAKGDWETRREEVGKVVIDSIARFCNNLPSALINIEVLGPPDVEKKVGLSGGHIFQGECLPSYMWNERLAPRTPLQGVFLCGACTHPGGSVIGINGRNAAMEIVNGTPEL